VRLVKQNCEFTLRLILEAFNNLIQQYQNVLLSGDKMAIRSTEKALTYLVTLTTSLYSYGMPSANSSLRLNSYSGSRGFADLMDNMVEQALSEAEDNTQVNYAEKYPDFIISSRIIYLFRITNQLVANKQAVYSDLEASLLQFGTTFKS
jgi:hypothetical protein